MGKVPEGRVSVVDGEDEDPGVAEEVDDGSNEEGDTLPESLELDELEDDSDERLLREEISTDMEDADDDVNTESVGWCRSWSRNSLARASFLALCQKLRRSSVSHCTSSREAMQGMVGEKV